jgi:hypothetical protein
MLIARTDDVSNYSAIRAGRGYDCIGDGDAWQAHHYMSGFQSNATAMSEIYVSRARGSFSSPAISQGGDALGRVTYNARNSTSTWTPSTVQWIAYVDSLGGATNDMPGLFVFKIAPDGSATSAEAYRINPNKEFMINGTTDRGNYKLQCNGTGVWGQGAYTNGSDERWKQDVTPLAVGLDTINQMNPVSYRYNDLSGNEDRRTHNGFIAQEIESLAISEGAISTDPNGFKSMSYQEVTPVLVKAVQELSAKVDTLQAQINGA